MASENAEHNEPTAEGTTHLPAKDMHEPAASSREPGEEGPERQYPPEANPRPWAQNSQAGVQLRTHREPYEAELAFRDKPSQQVIDHLKENGFRWNNPEKIWTRPVGYSSQAQDRLVAYRTYSKAVAMILEEKGLAPSSEPEIAF